MICESMICWTELQSVVDDVDGAVAVAGDAQAVEIPDHGLQLAPVGGEIETLVVTIVDVV